uniref:Uncharacterized protein n=1 Tax=Panagrolaimus sp. PS1159 TaxID=55785 RepID=A0AC35G8Q7_9BILA
MTKNYAIIGLICHGILIVISLVIMALLATTVGLGTWVNNCVKDATADPFKYFQGNYECNAANLIVGGSGKKL